MSRNLVQFTERDASWVMGRQITEYEYRAIATALSFSPIESAFEAVVREVCGEDDAARRESVVLWVQYRPAKVPLSRMAEEILAIEGVEEIRVRED